MQQSQDPEETTGKSVDDDLVANLDFPLPRFFVRRPDGLFVDLEHFQGSQEFRLVVERLIAAGCLFRGLEYESFCELMFGYEPGVVIDKIRSCREKGKPTLVRWATALERFDPARAALYRDVRIEDDEAVYLFERPILQVEVEVEVPDAPQPVAPRDAVEEGRSPDECAASGGEQATGTHIERRMVEQESQLDVDEFVIQMLLRGVRFGLDIRSVRDAIEQRRLGRVSIAKGFPPVEGSDASVRELAEGLHRDDSPRISGDGRVDLTQFRSHFPQVRSGVRLVQKVPPVLGKPGRNVAGEQLDPPTPKNFELESIAGPGTSIVRENECEFLVAAIDGFLSIDTQTNVISISEKIINKQGVSIRTTGNLALVGEEYEEYGEIQEGRTVTGKSITTHADVFGRLISSGGAICVKRNLSGGVAINRDGPVSVDGLATNAVINAPRGEIRLARAENCVLSGRQVTVTEQAIGCVIQAVEVTVNTAEGCAIAGQCVVIGSARQRGGSETLVSMLVPDIEGFERKDLELSKRLEALDEADERARHAAQQARAHPDVARYLELAARIKSGEIKLRPEQLPAFDALGRKAAPMLRAMGALSAEVEQRAAERARLQLEREQLGAGRQEACELVRCRIEQMTDGVLVRTLHRSMEDTPFSELSPADLRSLLRATTASGRPLAHQSTGVFEWQFAAPSAPDPKAEAKAES